jgi:hypothetical protein
MRPSSLFVLLPGFLPAACVPGPDSLSEGNVAAITQEVTEALAGLTEAMNSHDPDRVFAFYRQDEEFFYLGCTSSMVGWSTFSSRVASYYLSAEDVTFHREVVWTQVLGPTVAVVAMKGSSTEAPALFWTEVLKKGAEGRWLITYEHESWPGCSPPPAAHPMTTEGAQAVPGS